MLRHSTDMLRTIGSFFSSVRVLKVNKKDTTIWSFSFFTSFVADCLQIVIAIRQKFSTLYIRFLIISLPSQVYLEVFPVQVQVSLASLPRVDQQASRLHQHIHQ